MSLAKGRQANMTNNNISQCTAEKKTWDGKTAWGRENGKKKNKKKQSGISTGMRFCKIYLICYNIHWGWKLIKGQLNDIQFKIRIT